MGNINSYLNKLSLSFFYIWDKIWAPVYKRNMKYCEKGVYLRQMSNDIKGWGNLCIGDGISIPKESVLYCTRAEQIIGEHIISGIPTKLIKRRFTPEEIIEH